MTIETALNRAFDALLQHLIFIAQGVIIIIVGVAATAIFMAVMGAPLLMVLHTENPTWFAGYAPHAMWLAWLIGRDI